MLFSASQCLGSASRASPLAGSTLLLSKGIVGERWTRMGSITAIELEPSTALSCSQAPVKQPIPLPRPPSPACCRGASVSRAPGAPRLRLPRSWPRTMVCVEPDTGPCWFLLVPPCAQQRVSEPSCRSQMTALASVACCSGCEFHQEAPVSGVAPRARALQTLHSLFLPCCCAPGRAAGAGPCGTLQEASSDPQTSGKLQLFPLSWM